ncbi:unnamed protein product [Arctia plantaginis]|nr:unnamed protein product [Arctia plantaginis]
MECLHEPIIDNKVLANYVLRRMPYIFNYISYSVFSAALTENNVTWGQLRDHYSKLAVLVKEIDEQLSSFILLSFFTDLFFICVQLYNSLHRNHASFKNCGEEETKRVLSSPDYLLYYLYSFLFLVLRALFMSLFAANVYTAAQEPIFSIYDVSTSEYDQEVRQSKVSFRLAVK